jgi:hypothetical protein
MVGQLRFNLLRRALDWEVQRGFQACNEESIQR